MIFTSEHRFKYFYFFLSGLVASALLILLYFSLHETINNQRRETIKLFQRSLEFRKSSMSWNYNNTWNPIGAATLKHQIYSAYFDIRADVFKSVDSDNDENVLYGSLRIFAILPIKLDETIMCHVRQQDFTVSKILAQEATLMHDHHATQFAAYSIICPLHIKRNVNSVHLPLSVAISYASNSISRSNPTYVPISYSKQLTGMMHPSKPEIAVCVEPLQRKYTDALWMAEFVELYRIQGATRFYFYKSDASVEVLKVLNYYRQLGVVEILDWNTLQYGDDDIHEGGVVAQINDCLLRAMIVENYRYAAIVDLDEVIMPLKHNSLADYLRHCDEGRTSSFMFRNVFFYKKDANDMFSVPQHVRNRFLYTQNKVRRTLEIMPAPLRSRCVVNTRAILEMGRHQVQRDLSGFVETIVHNTVGLLFQYRDKCLNCKAALVIDYTARKYGSILWDRVDEVCLKVFAANGGICPLV